MKFGIIREQSLFTRTNSQNGALKADVHKIGFYGWTVTFRDILKVLHFSLNIFLSVFSRKIPVYFVKNKKKHIKKQNIINVI